MEPLLFIPLIISFFVILIAMPYWIKKTKQIKLNWEDMNKYKKPKIAGSGGIIVVMSFIVGCLCYIAIKTFVFRTNVVTIEIFTILTTILIASFVGFIDDIFGWQKGGLSAKLRVFLIFLAAVPLMVINAGHSKIGIPFVDGIDLGLLYPLIIIPIGIIGASTTFNFLAGYNGLEAGQGIIIIGGLSVVAYLTESAWLTLIGLCMIASLLAFLLFNKFPAKVFPGDVLTYSLGALIAIMAILGNFERIAVFFFVPYIIEVILKLRGKLKKQSFGKPEKDGSLELPYEKIYGLEHFSIWFLKKAKKKVYEKDVVFFIYTMQIIVIVLGFIIFRSHIFKI